MTDLNELMKKAKEMQEQMQHAQEEALKQVIVGESGAGMVRVQMNGRHDVVSVQLADNLMQEEKGVVEDLIAAAFNDAVSKVQEKNRETLTGMAGGFNLPEGFKFPF